MTYLDILKLLLPHGTYSDSDTSGHGKDISVHADGLSACQVNAESLLSEIFPDAADALLEDWERVYGLTQADKPTFQRLQNLLGIINARGGLSRSHIQAALRPFTGYDADIDEFMVFRCDDHRCLTDSGMYAMDEDQIFRFFVRVDPARIQTVGYNLGMVQDVVNLIRPAHTQGIVDSGQYGFFSDDPNSLTDLTLLGTVVGGFFCDDPNSKTDFTFLGQ